MARKSKYKISLVVLLSQFEYMFSKLKEIAKYQLTILNEKDYMKALKKLSDSVYIENKKQIDK